MWVQTLAGNRQRPARQRDWRRLWGGAQGRNRSPGFLAFGSTTRSWALSHNHGRLHTGGLGSGSRKQTGRAGWRHPVPTAAAEITPPGGSLTQRCLRNKLCEEGHEGRRASGGGRGCFPEWSIFLLPPRSSTPPSSLHLSLTSPGHRDPPRVNVGRHQDCGVTCFANDGFPAVNHHPRI